MFERPQNSLKRAVRMQNRQQKTIRRIDVRELEKMSLLELMHLKRRKTVSERHQAVQRLVRPGRWM